MTYLIAAVIALGVIAAAPHAARALAWKPLRKKRVMVQLNDEKAFDGILISQRGGIVVLVDATLRTADHTGQLAGSVHIERDRIAWIQVA